MSSYVRRGVALGREEVAELETIAGGLKRNSGKGHDRMAQLAVAWVLNNPTPVPLENPDYKR